MTNPETEGKDDGAVRVTAEELRRGVRSLLNRVEHRGETVEITRHGEPVAKLVPLDPAA